MHDAFRNNSNVTHYIRDSLLVLSVIEKESYINVAKISKETTFPTRKVNLCLKFLRDSGTIEQNGQSFKLMVAKIC